MKNLRILIVHQNALPPERAGIKRHFIIASELARRGHEVHILTGNRDYLTGKLIREAGQEPELLENVWFHWINVPDFSANTQTRLFGYYSFARAAKRMRFENNFDIVIGSSPNLLSADAALRISKAMNAKFILEIRDIWPLSIIELGFAGKWNPLILWFSRIEKKLYKSAHFIFSSMPFFSKYLTDIGFEALQDKLMVVRQPIQDSDIQSAPQNGKKPLKLVYAGAIRPANRVDIIIDALAIFQTKYPEIPFHMTVIGSGQCKDELISYAAEKCGEKITFTGSISDRKKLIKELSKFDFGLIYLANSNLYKYGTSLNKMLDYMAAGLPILQSTAQPGQSAYDAGAGIFADLGNAEDIAELVHKASACEESEIKLMGTAGLEYVRNFHGVSKIVDKIESEIEKRFISAPS